MDAHAGIALTETTELLLVLAGAFLALCAALAFVRVTAYWRRRDDAHLRSLAERQLDFAHRAASRDRFFAALLDEVRIPLAHLQREVAQASARCDGCDRARALAAASLDADRLWHLSNRIAALAEIGRRAEQRVPADLIDAARAAVDLVRPAADARGVTFVLDAPQPARCRHSLEAIRDALVELLENAVRASVEGSRVELRVRASDGSVRVEVEDFGPGVPPELCEALFDPFARASRAPHGDGLGLAIAREAARAHGGNVYFAPANGAGARVVLELPARRG